MKQNNVNKTSLSFLFLFAFILFIPRGDVLAINTVQTDAVLNGASESIRIWGQIDSFSECKTWDQLPNDLSVSLAGVTHIQPHIVLENYQDNSGQITFPIGNEIQLGDFFDVTFTLNNLYDIDYTNPLSLITGLTTDQSVVYISLQAMKDYGGYWDYAADCLFLVGAWENTIFTLLATNGGAGATFTPLSFNLISTSTNLLASVSGSIKQGVQTTGNSMWPLLVFLGVSVAFVIALQLVVFTKTTVGTTGGRNRGKRGKKWYHPY